MPPKTKGPPPSSLSEGVCPLFFLHRLPSPLYIIVRIMNGTTFSLKKAPLSPNPPSTSRLFRRLLRPPPPRSYFQTEFPQLATSCHPDFGNAFSINTYPVQTSTSPRLLKSFPPSRGVQIIKPFLRIVPRSTSSRNSPLFVALPRKFLPFSELSIFIVQHLPFF